MVDKKQKDRLKEYHKKRDFDLTSEPFGKNKKSKKDQNIFVIHKHDASSMHFDFRLEVDGVLKSWAVPKGPSTDPKEKRLAVTTEDHPLEYADFEGVIPEDEYGGGTVMVWDAGTYKNLKQENDDDGKSMDDALKNGEASVWLDGNKIKGAYALVRMSNQKKNWLLIKKDDDEADARRNPVSTENKSVLTGRTMKEIEKEGKKEDKKS